MAQAAPLHFLITGAARGIGRGLTRLLLAKGHRVFLVDSSKAELDHLVEAHLGPTFPPDAFQPSLTDLRRPAEITAAVTRAAAFFDDRLDVLVNNAALTAVGPHGEGADARKFEDLPLDAWNAYLETNLTVPMLLSQACVPLLRKGRGGAGGAIVNMSSTRARQSEPASEAYATTKAGIVGLTHAMAASLACDGITVNAVLPGWVSVGGECREADEAGEGWDEGLSEEDHAWHLSGRVGRVEDVLGTVEFLARERFVNGAEVVLDGGVSRRMVYPE